MNKSKEQNFVSSVIYVRNNEDTIEGMLKYVHSTLEKLFKEHEIICVNDGSTDKSEEIIRRVAKECGESISLVNMGYTQGIELSMNAGEDLAIGDFIFEFDRAKVYWEEDLMERVYEKMQEGYDIVSACPSKGSSFSSRIFYSIFNKASHSANKLRTESFRLVSRRAINRVVSMNHAQMYRKAVNANSALKQTFIEFEPQTDYKDMKASSKERRALAVDSLILFTDIGYKIAFAVSIIMLIFAAIVGIYTVIVFATGHPVEGWTPIMIFLAIGFFVLFLILTFVIKYLSLILNLNFKRQRYIVEEIIKL